MFLITLSSISYPINLGQISLSVFSAFPVPIVAEDFDRLCRRAVVLATAFFLLFRLDIFL